MRKKLLFFTAVLITFLFMGCPHKTEKPKDIKKVNNEQEPQKQTILKIKNESSQSLFKIRCDDKSFGNDTTPSGSFISKEYDRKIEGYAYFDIVWKEASPSSNFQITSVRTSEIIIVETGQEKTFVITDNTLVIPIGKQESVPLISLKPAFLYINDITSYPITIPIYSIGYAGNTCKLIYPPGGGSGEKLIRCDEDSEDYINFRVSFDSSSIADIDVKMFTKTSIKKGETKKVTITDDSKVFTAENCICTIKQLKNLRRLTVINNSHVQIQKISFGDQIYDRQLKTEEKYTLAFFITSDYSKYVKGNCEIVIDDKVYKVAFKDGAHLYNGSNTNFIITDDTEIIYNGGLYKIKDIPTE